MNAFVNNVTSQITRTTNGMTAYTGSGSAVVDLFFKAGASRGKDITKDFAAAMQENAEYAIRIALWLRDVRGGAGERELYRNLIRWAEVNSIDLARFLINKAPFYGRWDDVLESPKTEALRNYAFSLYATALANRDGLAAKWAPRKGDISVALRNFLGLTPKEYRKLVVSLSNTVEQKMCAKNWDEINFSHVPSLAAARYRKAFYRNAEDAYKAYVDALTSKDPKVARTVKVNAAAVYPYDVLKNAIGQISGFGYYDSLSATDVGLINAQWEALPNFVGSASILPIIDTSGSMTVQVGGNMRAIDVAVSLGVYLAEKNRSAFKDVYMTFSTNPKLAKFTGVNIVDKVKSIDTRNWEMSTDLDKAINLVLTHAINNSVPQEDMPKILLVLSDMQFNGSGPYTAQGMINARYEAAGYKAPSIVFWNINSHDNVPVKANAQGVALVSGFSPSIVKSVLSAENLTPESIMLKTIMNERYNIA